MKSLVLVLLVAACASATWKGIFPQPKPRIVGGSEVPAHSMGFIVALQFPDDPTWFCGGSIISESYVLTAAICVYRKERVVVIGGAHNISDSSESSQQVRDAQEITLHPAYNRENHHNDIALVKVDPPFELNDFVKTIALPTWSQANDEMNGVSAIAAGWGVTTDGSVALSPVLHGVQLLTISNSICDVEWVWETGDWLLIDDGHICCSGLEGRGACFGDYGGPLFSADPENQTLIGATSFVYQEGCEKSAPTVYTRITYFLEWISTNAGITIQQ